MGTAADDFFLSQRTSFTEAGGYRGKRIPCDIVVVAIGQGIESQHFAEEGVPIRHGAIDALDHSGVENMEGIFAGETV